MALDPSVIVPQQQPPINPLMLYSQVQAIKNAQAQNLLLGNANTEFQQKQAAGSALANAITDNTGPDGAVNGGGVQAELSQTAAGNPFLGDYTGQQLANTGAQTNNQIAAQNLDLAKLKVFQAHFGAVNDAVTGLLANPTVTKKDVVGAASGLVSNPDLDPDSRDGLLKQTISLVGSIPDNASPQAIHQRLQGLAMQTAGTQAQIANLIGQSTQTDTGSNIVEGRLSPLGGYQPTAVIKKGLSPEAAAQPTPVVVPNSQGGYTEGTVPLGQRAALAGPNGVTPTSPGLTGQGMSLADASQPQPVVNPTTGAQSFASKGAIAANPGAYSPGLAPGVQSSLTTAGAQAADMSTTLAKQAAGVPTRKAALDTALGLLDNFGSGPAAPAMKQVGELASQFGIAPPSTTSSTSGQEEFGKLAIQIAQSQFQSLGGTGTDARLESTMHTSPSELLSNQGNKNIIALLKGNEDAIAAQNTAYQAWAKTHPPSAFPQFQAQWNKIYDPRVFQSQYMSPDQIKTMKAGMAPAELQQFSAAQALAERYGWVQ